MLFHMGGVARTNNDDVAGFRGAGGGIDVYHEAESTVGRRMVHASHSYLSRVGVHHVAPVESCLFASLGVDACW